MSNSSRSSVYVGYRSQNTFFVKMKRVRIISVKILLKYLVFALCMHRYKFGGGKVTLVPEHFGS